MKKLTGFIITAGHLDIEWYQPMRSYRFWTIEALEDLKLAAKRPDFKTYVLDGQVFPLEAYLEVVPEDEGIMRALIQSGKLTIGPFYTQFDEWIPSAEAIIRNCLYGQKKALQYGGCMQAGYLPDNFGHPLQLPQILQNFGIDSLLFMRGMPAISGGHPDEFLYEGIDGSRLLGSYFRESYAGAFDIFSKDIEPMQPREVPYYKDYISYEYHKELAVHDDPERIARNMIANVREIEARYPSGIIPLIAGADHLPPQINVGESVKAANELQDDIVFVMGTAEEYTRMVYANLSEPAIYSMELLGSRYQYILLGALSTRTYLKRQHFACEALLERYAEPLTAIASCMGYHDKPRLLDEAWQYVMMNSAHDSIHGSSLDEVHVEMEARYAAVRQIASGVIHDTLSFMERGTKQWWGENDKGITIYSPAANGTQPAELWLPIGNEPVVIVDDAGQPLLTQLLAREEIPTNGIGLPRNDAMPHEAFRKVLFLKDCGNARLDFCAAVKEKASNGDGIKASDRFIENEWLRVDVAGALIHITDKVTQKTFHHLNLLTEEADAGDAWDYSPPWTPAEVVKSAQFPFEGRLVEQGAVRATLAVKGKLSVPACLQGDLRSPERVDIPVTFEISVYTGIRRVDIKLHLDNQAKDHRIRLQIPLELRTSHIRSQGHLAIIDRPVSPPPAVEADDWWQPPTQLYPCREWIAAEDSHHGLAIALKGLYDYEAAINPLTQTPVLSVTLLRGIQLMGRRHMMQRSGPASDACDTPGAQCLGMQAIEWSYIPYTADPENKAPFLPEAQGFLYPPVAHAVRVHPEASSADLNPATWSGLLWHAANLQFSAFKKALNGDGYILRLFENQGKSVQADIQTGPFRRAWLTNMNEEQLEEIPIRNGSISVAFGAYKAVTIHLSLI